MIIALRNPHKTDVIAGMETGAGENSSINKYLGEVLKRWRKEARVTQGVLAAEMHESDSAGLSRFERGQQGMPADKLQAAVEYLGHTIVELYAEASLLQAPDKEGKINEIIAKVYGLSPDNRRFLLEVLENEDTLEAIRRIRGI